VYEAIQSENRQVSRLDPHDARPIEFEIETPPRRRSRWRRKGNM